MIKLTNYFKTRKPVWVNASMIQSIELFTGAMPTETYTSIIMRSGQSYSVAETPEQVISIMSHQVILG